MKAARFTLDGSPQLERDLAELCEEANREVLQCVPAGRLQALVLGGGYGRGEGGVLRTGSGEQAYNDLEFYVFVRGNRWLNARRYDGALHEAAEKLSAIAGLDVEFKVISREHFERSATTMFYYDLACGHRVVAGEAEFLEHSPHRDAARIPMCEATRLLMNRCSGLLFSAEKLQRERFTSEDADFVGRNHAKAQLGLGDALLAAAGSYHWSCRERAGRLETLAGNAGASILRELPQETLRALVCHHRTGVEFKLHPERKTGDASTFRLLQAQLLNLAWTVWSALESERLGLTFASPSDYAFSRVIKCPETRPWRNGLINLRTFGARAAGEMLCRYPRERLLSSLALLLWEPACVNAAAGRRFLQRQLNSGAEAFRDFVDAYARLWRRFN